MANEEQDFEISEASISGTHQRDDVFNQQRRSRQRAARITAQLSVLVVIVLGAGFLMLRTPIQTFMSAHQGPAPTATRVPPPLAELVIETDVTFGTLTVNGTVMPLNPNNASDTVSLTKPHSTITLNASPFHPVTCTVDVATLGQPPNNGRCRTNSDHNNIFVLDMNLTIADLPPLAQQQFSDLTTKELASINALQATVPAQEHYAHDMDARLVPLVTVAPAPLNAQIQATINRSVPQTDTECTAGICPSDIGTQYDPSRPQTFNVQLALTLGWRFSNNYGQQIGSYLPINDEQRGANQAVIPDMQFMLQLQYNPSMGWTAVSQGGGGPFLDASSQLANDFCQTGAATVYFLSQQQGLNVNGSENLGAMSPLAGCLFAFNNASFPQEPPTATVTPAKDTSQAWFMVHFGAVLAVNAKAHAMLPTLPQATAQEVAEVEQATQ